MNGAPANPMSGTGDARRTSPIASSNGATAASGSNGRKRARSAAVRTGWSMTGPTPSRMSNAIAEPGQRGRDVGEQDRRVDAEAVHGLERDLGAQGGRRG